MECVCTPFCFLNRFNMITFRKAHEEDLPVLLQLLSYTWAVTYSYVVSEEILQKVAAEWHHEEKLLEQITNKKVHFILAEDEDAGKVAGLVTFVENDAEVLVIARLYTNPRYPRHGIGEELLNNAMEFIKGFKYIQVRVEESNILGINFYLKNKFHIIRKEVDKYEDTEFPIKVMQRIVE